MSDRDQQTKREKRLILALVIVFATVFAVTFILLLVYSLEQGLMSPQTPVSILAEIVLTSDMIAAYIVAFYLEKRARKRLLERHGKTAPEQDTQSGSGS